VRAICSNRGWFGKLKRQTEKNSWFDPAIAIKSLVMACRTRAGFEKV
jgi:hypothetical protein